MGQQEFTNKAAQATGKGRSKNRKASLGKNAKTINGPPAATLFLVLDKILPSAADSELRYKAEESALQRAIEVEIADRVKWHRHL